MTWGLFLVFVSALFRGALHVKSSDESLYGGLRKTKTYGEKLSRTMCIPPAIHKLNHLQ